jgi:uncharacterized protein
MHTVSLQEHYMRIAIIGSGVSGNVAAWALKTGSEHTITLYEKEPRLGGHSATVDVDYDGVPISVDTGFIVYNTLNYPNMVKLFDLLNVPTKESDMSFAVSSRQGKNEWAGKTKGVANGFFARRRNLVSPSHWRLLREMMRFNKTALADRAAGRFETIYAGLSMGEYLAKNRFSKAFQDDYLIPMCGAIWSTSPAEMLKFPAKSFITFFDHHRLMQWDRPVWRTVTGGSRAYVERLTAVFKDTIRMGDAVMSVSRTADGVEVITKRGDKALYDHVIFASHTDETLAMLGDATEAEQSVLGAIHYRSNDVILHRDPRFMPKRKAAWAAWNVLACDNPDADLCVTYWMNILQPFIPFEKPLFVTLNPPEPIAEDKVFGRYRYAHPQFDGVAIEAQQRLDTIQGQNHTWFCGAWQGYGFHEDGVLSGLQVAQALGAKLPWTLHPRDLDEN